jgi:hypothetical protein
MFLKRERSNVMRLSILVSVFTVAALIFHGAGVVRAATPSCGDTLTSDTTFDSDLDCSGIAANTAALTVGASNITINLKGYKIIGPGTATGCPSFSGDSDGTRGIVVEGFNNVTILNGAITGFERGIRVKDAVDIYIKNIEAYGNAFSAVRVRENAEVMLNRVYFHDNLNDAMGVSSGSQITVRNSRFKDNCASGIFVNATARADIKHCSFIGNYRSAVNFWSAYGSVMNSFLKGNNADSTDSGSSDWGQISIVDAGSVGDIHIRCNVIRDSVDVNGGAIERAIGFRDASEDAPTPFETRIIKNLFVNNPGGGVWFSEDGDNAVIDIQQNTFDNNTPDILLINGSDNWDVDATRNFFTSTPPVVDNGNNTVTDSQLKSPQHCRGERREE